jgi:hypothetical protein
MDQSRSRKDHGPQNLALLRRWALNACKLEGSKGCTKGQLKHAGGTTASSLGCSRRQVKVKCDSPDSALYWLAPTPSLGYRPWFHLLTSFS